MAGVEAPLESYSQKHRCLVNCGIQHILATVIPNCTRTDGIDKMQLERACTHTQLAISSFLQYLISRLDTEMSGDADQQPN